MRGCLSIPPPNILFRDPDQSGFFPRRAAAHRLASRYSNQLAGRVHVVHDRMPVFLDEDSFASWFDGSVVVEAPAPCPETRPHVWPVSKRVNRFTDGIDDPTLLEPIELSVA